MLTNTRKFHEFSQKAAFVCTLTFAFFIPFGPALTNLFLFFTLIFILLSGGLISHIQNIWSNEVSKIAILLFMLLAIGITWSIAETNDAFRVLKKYLPLLYIPMLMPIFNTEARKKIGAEAVRLSILSNKPPCPGSKIPLSLTPATRLWRLSNKSPRIEAKVATRDKIP